MTTTTVPKPSAAPSESALRRHPIFFYFLITFGISWIYNWIVFRFLGMEFSTLTLTPFLLGPILSSFIMTAATEGAVGVRRLLQRFVLWRVGFFWYLFAVIGIPVAYVFGLMFIPGAIASYQPISTAYAVAFPLNLVLTLLGGGALLEEPGWRGFALPRLQERIGPLAGTLILGVLWAAWHMPFYFIPGWADLNGGLSLASVAIFWLSGIAMAIIVTWVFNHTRGSLLMAMLVHASLNTFQGYANRLFPAVADSLVGPTIGLTILAILIVIFTGGRLGYAAYQKD